MIPSIVLIAALAAVPSPSQVTPMVDDTRAIAATVRFLNAKAPHVEFAVTTVHHGLLGTYVRAQQTHDGLPVFGGAAVVRIHLTTSRAEVTAHNLSFEPAFTSIVDDTRQATLQTPKIPGMVRSQLGYRHGVLVYVVDVVQQKPHAEWRHYLDATSENALKVLEVQERTENATGQGRVFDPNPVASSGNTALSDEGDNIQTELTAEMIEVVLSKLNDDTDTLLGQWVDVHNIDSRAQAADRVYLYERDDVRFEEVMIYFHVTRAQERIQTLGFDDVNNKVVEYIANGTLDDTSFHSTNDFTITMGSGGVDDAEDADVIVHEYGHSIHHAQVPGWGGGDERSMGEGFGDYLAASFNETLAGTLIDPNCISEWDATSYSNREPPCLNRTDSDKHFPEDTRDDVHGDGQIWSAALRRARTAIGADEMDRVVLEHHFLLTDDETFFSAANALLTTTNGLLGDDARVSVYRALVEHGLSRDVIAPPDTGADVFTALAQREVEIDLQPQRDGGEYADDVDLVQEFDVQEFDATFVQLHFSRLDLEENANFCFEGGCDAVYLRNDAGDLVQVLTGSADDFWSEWVETSTLQVRLVSDVSVGAFGYHIDRARLAGDFVDVDGGARDAGARDAGTTGEPEGTPDADGGGEVDAPDCACGGVARDGAGAAPFFVGFLFVFALIRRRRR